VQLVPFLISLLCAVLMWVWLYGCSDIRVHVLAILYIESKSCSNMQVLALLPTESESVEVCG